MENYKFHPLSELFPLMTQDGIRELVLDMKNNGQEEAIVLFEGKILDGRNRYLACKMFNIIPIFEELKKGIDPLTFIISKNLYRSHLNTAQRCEIALKLLKIERKKAKARQIRTQFNGKTENNIPKYKSVCTNLLPTDYDQVKGKAIDISAKKVDVSPTTLRKVIQIKKVAKEDPKIKRKWEKAKANKEETEDKLSIESIYQEIKKKEGKEKLTEKRDSNSNNQVTCKDCKRIIQIAPCPHCMGQVIICHKKTYFLVRKSDANPCDLFL